MKTLAHPRDTDEILRRLRELRPDSPRQWGRMSAHQMVCHLMDSFRVANGLKHVSPATGPVQRTIVKWIALYLPVRWPPGIPTRPEVDQEQGGTCPTDFATDVAALAAEIERTISPGRRFDREEHPIFGRMSRAGWLRWGYLHADHHLRQFGV